jgi:recombination DNA repair RAD52 pathway protein
VIGNREIISDCNSIIIERDSECNDFNLRRTRKSVINITQKTGSDFIEFRTTAASTISLLASNIIKMAGLAGQTFAYNGLARSDINYKCNGIITLNCGFY